MLARDVAEQVLADRAINGVEEAVYYHGEEVATRRRYDSRLLLAHLARLDARVEKDGAEALAGAFDDALVKLEAGERVPGPEPATADTSGPCAEEEAQEEVPLVEAALRWLEAERAKRGLDEGAYDDDPWGVEPLDDEEEAFEDGEGEDYAEETAGENSPP